jgi:tetratricopeptide (TPR) repeat protein
VDKIAGTFIDLSWTPPFHMSGSQLDVYELQYIESISEEEQDLGKASKQVRMEKRTVEIDPQLTSYRLDNLRGGCKYLNFQLIARNSHGISSTPVTCGDISTKESSRADALRKELKWARSTICNHIDSDFLTGVVQREEKQFYIEKLVTELGSIEGKGCDSCKVSDTWSDDSGQDSSHIEIEGVLTMSRRSEQFQFRINAILESITSQRREIELINSKRFFLSRQSNDLEERATKIKTELKRISDFDLKKFVISHIMHDSEQRFQVNELKSTLSKELMTCLSQIETWKNEIVIGDGRTELLLRTIEDNKEKLSERRAAFSLFQKKQSKSSILEFQSIRSNNELMKVCMRSWSKVTKESEKVTQRVLAISNHIKSSIHRIVLDKWKQNTTVSPKLEMIKTISSSIIGKAGRSLLNNETGRLDTMLSIQATLSSLKKDSTNTVFDDLYDPKVWNEHGLFGIVLGDHFFDEGDFSKAVDSYLSLPQIVESLHVDQHLKMQYLNVIELKIAIASKELGSYSNAILYFESIVLRSKAIGEGNRMTALAHLGLGEVHMHMKDKVMAQEHFSSALCASKADDSLAALTASAGQLLQQCISSDHTIQISDIVVPSTQDQIRRIDHELTRLDKLKSRLSYVWGLRLGFITPIENASITLVKIRMRKEDIKAIIKQKEIELNLIHEDKEKLPLLIKKIEEEITEAKCTNKRASSLVHDNPQVFQDQELRENLTLRLSESQLKFKKIEEKHYQLTTDIKNLVDEGYSLDENASIEECPLMNKILSNRKFRLMQFDKLGDSTERSSSNLVAVTIDRDIYLHDLRSGKAVTVFSDGECSSSTSQRMNGHTKTVTSLLFYGDKLYSGSMDKSLICWNIAKKALIFKSFGHSGTITCISMHDTFLLTGSVDKSVILWNINDGRILKQLWGHSRGILCLTTWPSYFASADADGEILIWNQEVRIYVNLLIMPCTIVNVTDY